jgi:hypothetical protein
LSVAPDQASVGDTVTFTFIFINPTEGTISDSTFSNNFGLVFYGGDRVITCSSPIIGGFQLRNGTSLYVGDPVTCTFPYLVSAADGANGMVDMIVSIDAPYVGSAAAEAIVAVS